MTIQPTRKRINRETMKIKSEYFKSSRTEHVLKFASSVYKISDTNKRKGTNSRRLHYEAG